MSQVIQSPGQRDDAQAPGRKTDVATALRALSPSVLGLALSRTAYLSLTFGSYRASDLGLMTDGTLLAAILVLLPFVALLWNPARHLSKPTVWRVGSAAFALQGGLLALAAVMFALRFAPPFGVIFVVNVLAGVAFAGSSFHWIRRARGAGSDVAALLVLLALAASEVFLCALAPLPDPLSYALAGAGALAQFACLGRARHLPLPSEMSVVGSTDALFGDSTRSSITSRRFLATMALGIAIMGFALGILRGYPTGSPIEFRPFTRLAYALVVIGSCVLICRMAARGHTQVMTTGIWVLMQLLGATALLLYAAFPGQLDLGAVFTTALNALMIAYMWYVTIAFIGCGPNDPYFYCISGWAAFLLPRAAIRTVWLTSFGDDAQLSFVIAVVGALLLVCSQSVFLRLYHMRDERGGEADDSLGEPLNRFLGLTTTMSPAEVRRAAVEQQVDEIRARYQLSDREAQVLALYVQGETQNKIAEDLGITVNTAHAHIKHIYAKCDLHSRQELLDFMRDYQRL